MGGVYTSQDGSTAFTVYMSAGSRKSGCDVCETVIEPPLFASPLPPPPPSPPSSSSSPQAATNDMQSAARSSASTRLLCFPIKFSLQEVLGRAEQLAAAGL